MTLLERYQADLAREDFGHDPKQAAVVRALQQVYEELIVREQDDRGGLFKHPRFTTRSRLDPVRGLYLWGEGGGRARQDPLGE